MIIIKCDRCGSENSLDPTFINSISAIVGHQLSIAVHNKDGTGFKAIHLCKECDHKVGAFLFNDDQWEENVCLD